MNFIVVLVFWVVAIVFGGGVLSYMIDKEMEMLKNNESDEMVEEIE